MRLTAKKLIDAGCCAFGVDSYFKDRSRKVWDAEKLFTKAIENGEHGAAAWAIAGLMPYLQRLEWAIWCAESVLHVWENYSDHTTPQEAIEAAKKCLENRSPENVKRACAAYVAEAHYDVSDAVYAADTASIAAHIACSAPLDTAENTIEVAHCAASCVCQKCNDYYGWAKEHEKILRKGLAILLEHEEQNDG